MVNIGKKIAITMGSVALIAGIGVGAANSYVAPGLHVNGVEFGLDTPNSASAKMSELLSNGVVNINDHEFTYDELGVSYNEDSLQKLLKDNKALRFNSWNKNLSQSIVINEGKMREAISEKIPEAYVDPVDADVVLNENGDDWKVVEGKDGTMPIVEDLRKAIEKDITAENRTDEVDSYELNQETIAPKITNDVANKFTNKLNGMADEAGYYEGDELKVEIPKSDFAELVKVEKTEDGFSIVPVEDSLRNYAETVPEKVNQKVDNGKAVVDENGKVLKTLDEWQDGYKFNDVEGLVSQSIEQLNNGESKFALNGEITEAKVDERFRRIEVDLSARVTRTYENDKLVKTYPVAIGKASTPTDKGQFKVFHQTKLMDMGCTPAYDYCTKDVPFATFYNGGEAFHGTWWHNDFGNTNGSMRSHGCVNMTRSDAEEIYYFAQTGTPVHVY